MQEIDLSTIYNLPGDKMGTMSLLGIEKAIVKENAFSVVMEVTEVHLNTQGVVHGGVLFTLCDQAVGAYLVYKNLKGLAVDGNIHYYRPAQRNDILTATATERKAGEKIGVYLVELVNQDNKLIADGLFTAMYFINE